MGSSSTDRPSPAQKTPIPNLSPEDGGRGSGLRNPSPGGRGLGPGTDTRRIAVVDSHTEGEPTRVVLEGGPDLGSGSLAERRHRLRTHHDDFRRAVVCEPRGSDSFVGALLCEPVDRTAAVGVIFFNNVGYLGMCGHATMGVVTTLAHLGRLEPGRHTIETPVGTIATRLHDNGKVTFRNVPCFRHRQNVEVSVEGHGVITGDVAWGGNWFFLSSDHGQRLALAEVDHLTAFAWSVRHALVRDGITGADGEEIDHIELFSPPTRADADGKNFVLCPGGAYDRSPCGTGTSAKLACLFADQKLAEGQVWRQEGIIGSVFEGFVEHQGRDLLPSVTGRAFVTAEAELILQPDDPLRAGIAP